MNCRALIASLVAAGSLALAAPSADAVTTLNVARSGTATQSSTDFGGLALRANDGSTDGNYGNNSVSHTASNFNAFWEVDLGGTSTISSVNVFNRADCCGNRLGNFRVSVLDAGNVEQFGANFAGPVAQGGSQSFAIPDVPGSKVRVQFNGLNPEGNGWLSLAEVQVMGDTAVPNFTNLARSYGTATQSTTDFGGHAGRAIDGNTNGNYGAGSVTHTLETAPNNFWMVDLGAELKLENIQLFNRTDCCGGRRATTASPCSTAA
jgi:hypothetical protein